MSSGLWCPNVCARARVINVGGLNYSRRWQRFFVFRAMQWWTTALLIRSKINAILLCRCGDATHSCQLPHLFFTHTQQVSLFTLCAVIVVPSSIVAGRLQNTSGSHPPAPVFHIFRGSDRHKAFIARGHSRSALHCAASTWNKEETISVFISCNDFELEWTLHVSHSTRQLNCSLNCDRKSENKANTRWREMHLFSRRTKQLSSLQIRNRISQILSASTRWTHLGPEAQPLHCNEVRRRGAITFDACAPFIAERA